MKAIHSTKKTGARALACATVLSAVLLCAVACTKDDMQMPGDTSGEGSTVTTGDSGNMTTPLNPDAGTVNPDGDAGDPPTGTQGESEGRSFASKFMH